MHVAMGTSVGQEALQFPNCGEKTECVKLRALFRNVEQQCAPLSAGLQTRPGYGIFPTEPNGRMVHGVPRTVYRIKKLKMRPRPTKGCNCLDSRLTVNCEILATCSSTYSPVRTSQEAHSVSIK
jgi:hypothetical protein